MREGMVVIKRNGKRHGPQLCNYPTLAKRMHSFYANVDETLHYQKITVCLKEWLL